jgi:putative intracellular protease/amidase
MSPAAGALFETIKSEAALLSPTTQQDHESEPSGMDGGSKSKRRRTSALSANAGMRASDGADHFHPRLAGKTVVIFVDFQFEDLELMYPKIRLEEEGAKVVICGIHEAPMKYTGKYGYPITSDITIAKLDVASVDGLIIPGGFAPDFMRRSHLMLDAISALNARRVPIGAICHGGWMLCSGNTQSAFTAVILFYYCTLLLLYYARRVRCP